VNNICMPEDYRTLEAPTVQCQGPGTSAGLCRVAGCVVDSIDGIEFGVPLTLPCNRHSFIFS
jgi:hypothetical protein